VREKFNSGPGVMNNFEEMHYFTGINFEEMHKIARKDIEEMQKWYYT
jgi:hypothetical protein